MSITCNIEGILDTIYEGEINDLESVFDALFVPMLDLTSFSEVDNLLIITMIDYVHRLSEKNQRIFREIQLRFQRIFANALIHGSSQQSTEASAGNYDKYGEIKIEELTEAEIQSRVTACTIIPSELPRVPGKSYRLIERQSPNDPGITIEYTIAQDGTIQSDNEGPERSGFNGSFNDQLFNP